MSAAHPDAELLRLGRRWQKAGRVWLHHHDGAVSAAAQAEFGRVDARIQALPAQTAAGVAVRLRSALLHSDTTGAAEALLFGCRPDSDDLFQTSSQQLTWQAIETLEQLAGRA